ncbi:MULTISPECIES: glycosyltransferase family 2 protein [unclassified Parafrankia]|uniref:glycosyltransferase family 2 protein n=1 Tax=unclassified Parafrankia TaxID=2994368 RepID=UPI000DA5A567|nr:MULTISPECIES: galactosyltransferase-related protein [unclassified Parafrankia]TCJ36515.1 glycosyltransferase family 2 protein [Parafrankia sp. BMG5.11]CAI7979305.1 Glycosyltransferase family 2 protein [Frankia sp. Hr75.2]SQD97652.1 putative glycosyltransferase [Parafrankia sp. Ea1.12]
MHNLLAVVVSYGGSPQLHCLLATLAGVTGCRVALVENRPGTVHEDLPAGVELYEGHGNVGYGTAVNIAVLRALRPGPAQEPRPASPPEWLLVVNSDVTMPERTRDLLPDILGSIPADADVVGFPVQAETGLSGRSTAVLPSIRTNAYTAVRGEAAAVERWPELCYPVGAFFAIRTQEFLRMGGFDPSYWMYYEETDLFARLHASGGRIAWIDDCCHVTHVGGGTVGRAGLMYAELGRSAAIYARRHGDTLGRGWLAVHVAQLAALALRKLATGRTHDALRASRILSGVATGLVQPRWEPATQSRWRAVPVATRRDLGRMDTAAPGQVPAPRASRTSRADRSPQVTAGYR